MDLPGTGDIMSSIFTSFTCSILPNNHRQLSWTVLAGLTFPANYILQVENSRAGGPWEVLDDDLKDKCVWEDPRLRNYNKYMNEHYRLRLIVPGENGEEPQEYLSDIVAAGTLEAWPFSAEAKNVVTQVEKQIEISGCSGVLLKKKHWGTRCPDCTDFANQNTVNEHCPRCLGTGYDGGYYQGISLSVLKDTPQTGEEQSFDAVEGHETVTGKCVAFPWIRYGDVWVEDGTNKRFYVRKVTPASVYKQTVLVYSFEMRRIEYTDIMYEIPADEKVDIKDVYQSSQVEYTPALEKTLEEQAMSDWEKALEEQL